MSNEPRCPNYGHCIPGIECTGEEGCLIYTQGLTLRGLEINMEAHLEMHREMNGDLRVVAEWANDMAAARRIIKRWVRPVVVAGGVAVIGTGSVSAAALAILALLGRLAG